MGEPVSAVTLVAVAAVLGSLGYFVRFQRRFYLVVDFGPDATDRAALSSLVGTLALFVAGLTGGLGVATALGRTTPEVWSAYALTVVVATAMTGVAGRATYGSGPEEDDPGAD